MTAKVINQDIQNSSTAQKLEWIRVLLSSEFIGQPGKEIIETLENAHFNRFCPYNDPFDVDEYQKLVNEEGCIVREINQLLPIDKQSLLSSYEDVLTNVSNVENRMIYRQGLRDGFLLAIELFGGGV